MSYQALCNGRNSKWCSSSRAFTSLHIVPRIALARNCSFAIVARSWMNFDPTKLAEKISMWVTFFSYHATLSFNARLGNSGQLWLIANKVCTKLEITWLYPICLKILWEMYYFLIGFLASRNPTVKWILKSNKIIKLRFSKSKQQKKIGVLIFLRQIVSHRLWISTYH